MASLGMLYLSSLWSESCSVVSDCLWPHGLSLPCSSVYGLLKARILEWVAIPFSRWSSQPKDRTHVSHIVGVFFTVWATREVLELLISALIIFFFFFLKEMPVSFSSSKGWPCVLFILTLAHSDCQLICWTVIFILLALWLSNCKWRESYKQWKMKWPSSVSQWHGVFGSLMSYSFWRRYEKETQPTYCWISPHTDFCEVNYLKSLFLCDPCYEASKFFFRCSVSHQEVKTVEDILRFSP